jgi:hypothetical protein
VKWGRSSAGPTLVDSKLQKRLAALNTPVVRDWADFYLNTCGKMLLEYGRNGIEESLIEAEAAAESLLAAVRELKRRA